MDLDSRRFIVVTGGPGSGKSTLIDALERQGFARSVEAGRAIIQDQSAIDGPGLPWRDSALFAELMLVWELRSHRMAHDQPGPVFFDRGVPDVAGYLRLSGLPVPPHVVRACERIRYRRAVLIAPPWPTIYARDSERRQSFEEAAATHDAMVAVYTRFGYDVIPLPLDTVEARVAFVLESLERAARG